MAEGTPIPEFARQSLAADEDVYPLSYEGLITVIKNRVSEILPRLEQRLSESHETNY